MKWAWRIMLLVALVAGLAIVARKFFVDEPTRIKRHIAAMEQAVEQGNMLRLSDGLAHDYSDAFGFDKQTLVGTVLSYRRQFDQFFIHITDLTVQVEADEQEARAVLVARVVAEPKGAGHETELIADRFRLLFRKTEDGWKLYRVETPELRFE